MGPNVEYATQNPSGPIELRIYPGADGTFKYYEDENDGYNYEKGKYATFTFKWNDKLKQLSIFDRKGSFAGMVQKHVFHVVLVKPGHGVSGEVTEKADKIANFDGKKVIVKL